MGNHGECGEAYSKKFSMFRMHAFIKYHRPSISIDFSSTWLSVQRISLHISICMYSFAVEYSRGKANLSVIDRMVGSLALSMTYGVDIRPTNDPNLEVARHANAAVTECLTTGSVTVDLFPLLKHLPPWVPGASFHQKAKVSRQYAIRLKEGIYSDGRNKMVIPLSAIYISGRT